ncbi:molybdopterin-guanine dinucleotide biosynthesis protein A [Halarchaeum rubridurum]|uniref:Molybdenum cofactor guanylyltransferase n=1 Tax=Halarchaeum rubridurum TaxID=489911 RepID=A0A830G3E5_9EURY|nr:molybdenum cofactor guanylyltransferase [Halarchaeum rubridurum]MBP1955563.1 molybdopterin-guanine dinucleotide biosynthesis protein A [Halarchaeum rubridurum]GGM73394.1 molybdenum cofactor guanylyltransferase [Halarchaeum rubridurum]
MHAAVVVAGGHSTRFGERDKATASLAGTPLIRRVADRLAGPIDALVVNCRPAQRERIADALADYPRPVTYALDGPDRADEGPLAGMCAGLRATDAERAFVVACDVPFVDPAFVRYLFDRAAAREAAVPYREGYPEALHAVYAVEPAVGAVERALAEDRRRADAALADLDVSAVGEAAIGTHAAPGTFTNLNTRAAFDAAEERLGRR